MPNQLVPRAPRIVTPRSFAPTDILSAIVQTQKNAYEDLIVRPLQALGVKAPEQPPTPEMLLQRVAPQIEKMARGEAEQGSSPKRGELPSETPVVEQRQIRVTASRGSL